MNAHYLADKPIEQRIEEGVKIIEATIAKNFKCQIEPLGSQLIEVSVGEDRHRKIDRWVITAKGTKMSIQIKGRQTGDDLIYEAIKNTRTWETGRDYKCEADLYLYANTTGKGGLYWMKHIKPEVYALVEQAKKDLDSNPCKMRWDGDGYEMKVITDHRHGNEKLMIFFYPNHFSHVPFTHLYD